MKAPARAARRAPHTKEKVRAYSALMYKARKEVSPVGREGPDVLGGRFGFPRPVLLRLVSVEASRLSRSNRLKVVTARDVKAAVKVLRHKVKTRAAA